MREVGREGDGNGNWNGRGKRQEKKDGRDRSCQRNGVLPWESSESLRRGKYLGLPVVDEDGMCMVGTSSGNERGSEERGKEM